MIGDGSYVVIERYSYLRIQKVSKSQPLVQLGKDSIDTSAFLDRPFESVFKLVPDSKRKKGWELSHQASDASVLGSFEEQFAEGGCGRDNRDLNDGSGSQALSRDEIEGMKSDRVDGSKIVEQLVENSSSFASKTKFSQEKFVRKKSKKYFPYVVARRPTVRLLQQVHYRSDPTKIMNLRIDSLAQMLNNANVRAGGRYVVYEAGCQGLVVSSALERVAVGGGGDGGGGKIVHVFHTGTPQTQCLLAMNYPRETVDEHLLTVNVTHLRCLEQGSDLTAMHQNGQGDGKPNFRQSQREQSIRSYDVMKDRNMDGLLIASRQHPTNLLLHLMTYLAPSRPFVVFSPYKEPLLDAYVAVKETGKAVMVTLSETWLRNYQVLPDRTHPEVNMSGGGGYLLSGIVVDNASPEAAGVAKEGEEVGNGGGKRLKTRR